MSFRRIAKKTNFRDFSDIFGFRCTLQFILHHSFFIEKLGKPLYSNNIITNNIKRELYTLDGTFLSLEDLTNQFFYCDTTTESSSNPNNNNDNSNTYSIDDVLFGTSKRFESKCDLSTLIYNNEMYFYDVYLVDEGDTSTISSCNNNQQNNINEGIDTECLYPIPVLNRNFTQGLSSPNMNRFKEDTFDDRYTRRFFLFDNVSGWSAMNGHEILRCAKTIVLQTTMQNEDPSKIYPPRLIIEYDEVFVNSIINSPLSSPIIFKIEYTMDTKNFWKAVKIIVGFVSAIAALTLFFYQSPRAKWDDCSVIRCEACSIGLFTNSACDETYYFASSEYVVIFAFLFFIFLQMFAWMHIFC